MHVSISCVRQLVACMPPPGVSYCVCSLQPVNLQTMQHTDGNKPHLHDIAKLSRYVLPFCLQSGVLDKYGVELIGAKLPSINKAEDRELFKQAMVKIGLKTPPSSTISNWSEALEALEMIGKFPLIIRPAFTLGGTGGGIAYNMDEYQEIINAGLNASVTNQVCQAVHDVDLTVLLSSAAAASGPRDNAPGLQHSCSSALHVPFTHCGMQALSMRPHCHFFALVKPVYTLIAQGHANASVASSGCCSVFGYGCRCW